MSCGSGSAQSARVASTSYTTAELPHWDELEQRVGVVPLVVPVCHGRLLGLVMAAVTAAHCPHSQVCACARCVRMHSILSTSAHKRGKQMNVSSRTRRVVASVMFLASVGKRHTATRQSSPVRLKRARWHRP